VEGGGFGIIQHPEKDDDRIEPKKGLKISGVKDWRNRTKIYHGRLENSFEVESSRRLNFLLKCKVRITGKNCGTAPPQDEAAR
jgi:hypothetical protein